LEQDNELLIILDDDTLRSLGFVHFYGEWKPWAAAHHGDTSSFPAHIAVARDLWLKDFNHLSSLSNAKHSNPLTQIGIDQYRRALVLYVSKFDFAKFIIGYTKQYFN
jgi:hypothetical protein